MSQVKQCWAIFSQFLRPFCFRSKAFSRVEIKKNDSWLGLISRTFQLITLLLSSSTFSSSRRMSMCIPVEFLKTYPSLSIFFKIALDFVYRLTCVDARSSLIYPLGKRARSIEANAFSLTQDNAKAIAQVRFKFKVLSERMSTCCMAYLFACLTES